MQLMLHVITQYGPTLEDGYLNMFGTRKKKGKHEGIKVSIIKNNK